MPEQFEKVPFVWNEPRALNEVPQRLTFQPQSTLSESEFIDVLSQIMHHSLDAGDQHAVATHGSTGAARNFLAEVNDGFDYEPDWWQVALDQDHNVVGLILPVIFQGGRKDNREEGTIYYMGVLPAFRGNQYGYDLLCRATRTLQTIGVWRIFCDTDSQNRPMINAFVRAGYSQAGAPYMRPL